MKTQTGRQFRSEKVGGKSFSSPSSKVGQEKKVLVPLLVPAAPAAEDAHLVLNGVDQVGYQGEDDEEDDDDDGNRDVFLDHFGGLLVLDSRKRWMWV